MDKTVTKNELSQNDGQNGRPAWIAYQGKVYDVSDSAMWSDGDHLAEHVAGRDLTDEMMGAPHDETNLEQVKYVGLLGQ